jgi:hypothetical protein
MKFSCCYIRASTPCTMYINIAAKESASHTECCCCWFYSEQTCFLFLPFSHFSCALLLLFHFSRFFCDKQFQYLQISFSLTQCASVCRLFFMYIILYIFDISACATTANNSCPSSSSSSRILLCSSFVQSLFCGRVNERLILWEKCKEAEMVSFHALQ